MKQRRRAGELFGLMMGVGALQWAASGCVPRERHEEEPASARAPRSPKAVQAPRAEVAERAARAAKPAATDAVILAAFVDDFTRPSDGAEQLGPNWRATSSAWAISDGRLCGESARNHPVWLARRLPRNASIEFDALSESNDGDIKAEFWGDGRSAATGQSYTDATSYLAIFGGWKNRYHVLARIDEHAPDRREIKLQPGSADPIRARVVPNRVYQFRVERRDGRTVRWLVDGTELLTYADPEPLAGPGHEHFGFNDWQARVCFDNLRITPLEN